jgi:polyhydroxyalkanoate synthesis regulator phasin
MGDSAGRGPLWGIWPGLAGPIAVPDAERDVTGAGDDVAGSQTAIAQWQRFARPWIEQAQTWGFPLDSPGLGAAREFNERWRNAMSAWLDVTRARTEYAAVLIDAWRGVFEELAREMLRRSRDGFSAQHPRALLSVSVDLADRIFAEMFRSPRYVEAQRQLLDAVAASRLREGELIEDMASSAHVATRRELDEVYRRIDELRREIRALKKAQSMAVAAGAAESPPKRPARRRSA